MKHGILTLALLVLIVVGSVACFTAAGSAPPASRQVHRSMMPQGSDSGVCC